MENHYYNCNYNKPFPMIRAAIKDRQIVGADQIKAGKHYRLVHAGRYPFTEIVKVRTPPYRRGKEQKLWFDIEPPRPELFPGTPYPAQKHSLADHGVVAYHTGRWNPANCMVFLTPEEDATLALADVLAESVRKMLKKAIEEIGG